MAGPSGGTGLSRVGKARLSREVLGTPSRQRATPSDSQRHSSLTAAGPSGVERVGMARPCISAQVRAKPTPERMPVSRAGWHRLVRPAPQNGCPWAEPTDMRFSHGDFPLTSPLGLDPHVCEERGLTGSGEGCRPGGSYPSRTSPTSPHFPILGETADWVDVGQPVQPP